MWLCHGLEHRARNTRELILLRFWQVCVVDKFWSQRSHTSEHADATEIRVLVEGWNEETCVGSRFAACMWMYTKAVLSDRQGPTQEELRRKTTGCRNSTSSCRKLKNLRH